jgi:hypothetical protein
MEPTAPRLLKLGDELDGTVIKPIGGNRYEVRCRKAPRGWTVTLQTLRNESVDAGQNLTFWVSRVVPIKNEVHVREGDYGRLPISPAMAPRYLAAVRVLLGQLAPTGDLLGDARVMIDRIGTQNHADWLTVWRLIGEPDSGQVKHLLVLIDRLRTAQKEAPETVPDAITALSNEFGPELSIAEARLKKIIAAQAKATAD